MRFHHQRNLLAALALGCILTAIAGCRPKQPAVATPAKPAAHNARPAKPAVAKPPTTTPTAAPATTRQREQ